MQFTTKGSLLEQMNESKSRGSWSIQVQLENSHLCVDTMGAILSPSRIQRQYDYACD